VNIKIKEIPLSEFDLSLSEMRVMNQSRMGQLEKSMRLHGQLQPVVARVYEGGVQMIDGFKRLYISETLMMDSLQCQLLDVDLSQAKVLLLSYNRSSQSMEAWEEAVVLKDLMETHDLGQHQLAKLTGYSPSWISRRLSLIGKLDEEVSSEIRMGVLTSSHARSLIRLPRGNQLEMVRAINTHLLSSRQTDRLVDAFLEAKDKKGQRSILDYPERVLINRESWTREDLHDPRLSGYGNDLARSMDQVIRSIQILLSLFGNHRIEKLNQIEKVIITPGFAVLTDGAETLRKSISQLQIHKQAEQDER